MYLLSLNRIHLFLLICVYVFMLLLLNCLSICVVFIDHTNVDKEVSY